MKTAKTRKKKRKKKLKGRRMLFNLFTVFYVRSTDKKGREKSEFTSLGYVLNFLT